MVRWRATRLGELKLGVAFSLNKDTVQWRATRRQPRDPDGLYRGDRRDEDEDKEIRRTSKEEDVPADMAIKQRPPAYWRDGQVFV